MDKIILHCDLNSFYASVEMLFEPKYREVPFAVGGDVESRHGIILAKNALAKKAGVSTGEPLWSAKQKCPDIVFCTPNFKRYLEFSKKVSDIFRDYTDEIESFGIDESWLDVSKSAKLYGSGVEIAKLILNRVLDEVGLTISIGISDNKIYSKLGSDLANAQEIVLIDRNHLETSIYPLPVDNLLFVGRKTKEKLLKYGIESIGDLCQCSLEFLELRFKKWGRLLWQCAHGIDQAPVSHMNEKTMIKSIGNSVTAVHDLRDEKDLKIILYRLCESVCERLREQSLVSFGVQVSLRDYELNIVSKQEKLCYFVNDSQDVFNVAYRLVMSLFDDERPLRSLGVKLFELKHPPQYVQADLFNETNDVNNMRIDEAMSVIRKRFGQASVGRAIMLMDPSLSSFYPKTEHVIHPIAYLKSGIK